MSQAFNWIFLSIIKLGILYPYNIISAKFSSSDMDPANQGDFFCF